MQLTVLVANWWQDVLFCKQFQWFNLEAALQTNKCNRKWCGRNHQKATWEHSQTYEGVEETQNDANNRISSTNVD